MSFYETEDDYFGNLFDPYEHYESEPNNYWTDEGDQNYDDDNNDDYENYDEEEGIYKIIQLSFRHYSCFLTSLNLEWYPDDWKKLYWGKYECKECGRVWSSARCLRDRKQKCQNCGTWNKWCEIVSYFLYFNLIFRFPRIKDANI